MRPPVQSRQNSCAASPSASLPSGSRPAQPARQRMRRGQHPRGGGLSGSSHSDRPSGGFPRRSGAESAILPCGCETAPGAASHAPYEHPAEAPTPSIAAPRDVRIALAYLRRALALRMTMPELAQLCGVPERTLHRHFVAFVGRPPLEHLRRMRLSAVRDALLAPDGGATVTRVATGFGFLHLGASQRNTGSNSASRRRRRSRGPGRPWPIRAPPAMRSAHDRNGWTTPCSAPRRGASQQSSRCSTSAPIPPIPIWRDSQNR
jgi:AraC-like DNA-binding protein